MDVDESDRYYNIKDNREYKRVETPLYGLVEAERLESNGVPRSQIEPDVEIDDMETESVTVSLNEE